MKKINFFACLLAIILSVSFLVSCDNSNKNRNPSENLYDDNKGIDFKNELEPLVVSGTSAYKIVISADSTVTESYAASELSKYIKASTSVSIPVVIDSELKSGNNNYIISVGKTKFFKENNLNVTDQNLDSFIIKSIENSIIICGYRDRGTLYGVYDFLEKFVGVKFLTVKYEYIPQLDTIKLYKSDIIETPVFMSRSHFVQSTVYDSSFAAKMRMVNPHQKEGLDYVGGGFRDSWLTDFHSFNALVPINSYYEKHPEWFSSQNLLNYQPVLSNGLNDDGTIKDMNEDGVIDDNDESYLLEIIKVLKQKIIEKPNVTNIMIGQQDNQNPSKNPDCLRQIELFGGHAGQLIVFTNAVAKAIEDWMQENNMNRTIFFSTFAYQYTFGAPVQKDKEGNVSIAHPAAKPRHNVYIMLAPVECSYNEPLNDANSVNNKSTYLALKDWEAITDRFFVFDYTVNFSHLLAWYPNYPVIAENLKYYEALGVKEVYSNGPSGDLWLYYQNDMYTYVYSKLMWNPNRDIVAITQEFNKYYFGSEAGAIIDDLVSYFNAHFRNIAEGDGKGTLKPGRLYSQLDGEWLTASETLNLKFLNEAQRYVDRAYAVIEKSEVSEVQKKLYNKHILAVEVQIMAMKYINYDEVSYTDDKSKMNFLNEFFTSLQLLEIQKLDGSLVNDLINKFGL